MKIKATNFRRRVFFIFFDIFIIFTSMYIAFLLRFDFNIPIDYINSMYISIGILIILRIMLFYIVNIYDISWRHFGFQDSTKITYMLIFSTINF